MDNDQVPGREPQAACSFCDRPRSQVRDLIVSGKSPYAYICDACIEICGKILSGSQPLSRAGKTAVYHIQKDRELRTMPRQCSFCGRSLDRVAKLIASPLEPQRHYICDRCASIAANVLVEEPQQRSTRGPAAGLKQTLAPSAARLHRLH